MGCFELSTIQGFMGGKEFHFCTKLFKTYKHKCTLNLYGSTQGLEGRSQKLGTGRKLTIPKGAFTGLELVP